MKIVITQTQLIIINGGIKTLLGTLGRIPVLLLLLLEREIFWGILLFGKLTKLFLFGILGVKIVIYGSYICKNGIELS